MSICKPVDGLASPVPGMDGNGAGITLLIEARDADGKIIYEECKDNDLYLKNWGLLLCGMLKEAINNVYADTYKGHNLSGDTFNLYGMVYADPTISDTPWAYGSWGNKARVRLGSSSTAATIADYDVLNYIMEVQPTAPVMTNAANVLKLMMTSTAAVENETTFAEVALCIRSPFERSTAPTPFCITRDTFTPVTVPAGGSLTISFEFWFNGMPE